jgi:hypothetical protein
VIVATVTFICDFCSRGHSHTEVGGKEVPEHIKILPAGWSFITNPEDGEAKRSERVVCITCVEYRPIEAEEEPGR